MPPPKSIKVIYGLVDKIDVIIMHSLGKAESSGNYPIKPSYRSSWTLELTWPPVVGGPFGWNAFLFLLLSYSRDPFHRLFSTALLFEPILLYMSVCKLLACNLQVVLSLEVKRK
jgi:hypothetical protein